MDGRQVRRIVKGGRMRVSPTRNQSDDRTVKHFSSLNAP
jgi:hypothetical protein